MSFYAIAVRIYGTVNIKASTKVKAEQILERLRSKTIDARHTVCSPKLRSNMFHG